MCSDLLMETYYPQWNLLKSYIAMEFKLYTWIVCISGTHNNHPLMVNDNKKECIDKSLIYRTVNGERFAGLNFCRFHPM